MALPWKHGLVHSTQVFVRLLLSLAVSHAIAREVCDDISMLQQSMYKPSDAPLALMATATEAPTTTTEAPVLTPPPPPKATRVNVVGVTGIIASFDAETKVGTINKVTEICKARGFVESGECKTCDPPTQADCCLQFKQPSPRGGAPVLVDWPRYDGGYDIEVLVTFAVERGMDQSLVSFLRDLPLAAAGRRNLATQFQSQGIVNRSQLAGINPVDVDLGSEDSITRNNVIAQLATAKDVEREKSKKKTDIFDFAAAPSTILANQAQAQAKEALDAAASARDALASATRELAQNGNAALSAQTAQNLQNTLDQLNRVNLQAADLDVSGVSASIDQQIASGGFVSGRRLGTLEMVELYGLLRGVLVTDRPGQDGMPVDRLASVCSFKPRLAKEEDQLRAAITLDADLETNEYFLQAEQASDVQTANSIITSYGTSAMTALANNFGAGLSASAGTPKVAGTGSAGVAESSSSSSGDAVRSRESATRILQSKTKELSKTRYYFAPKLAINIDPYQLQASPEFGLSWSEIAYLLCQQKGGTDCSKFQVEENVYGVEFADDSKPDEARATTVVSFVATNFATTATLSASVLPTFEGAIRAAFEGTLTVEDGEQIVVEVSYPSALVVEDIFSNVQVVVKIPPKPYPDAKPTTTRTRPEWFRQWFARGLTRDMCQLPCQKRTLNLTKLAAI